MTTAAQHPDREGGEALRRPEHRSWSDRVLRAMLGESAGRRRDVAGGPMSRSFIGQILHPTEVFERRTGARFSVGIEEGRARGIVSCPMFEGGTTFGTPREHLENGLAFDHMAGLARMAFNEERAKGSHLLIALEHGAWDGGIGLLMDLFVDLPLELGAAAVLASMRGATRG
jgi:hypothetical protein